MRIVNVDKGPQADSRIRRALQKMHLVLRSSVAQLVNRGDIATTTGTQAITVAVGTNGQGLIADNTQPGGLKYSNVVTSVALSAPGIFTVSGSPVTTTGTLTFSLNTQVKNTFFVGPTSGANAAPTFRVVNTADLGTGTASSANFLRGDLTWSSAGTVSSVALTVPSFLSVSGSPITSNGTLAVTLVTETANTIFAGPTTGAAATPTFRALGGADFGLTTADLTAQSAAVASVVAVTSPNDGVNHQYRIGGYLTVTAVLTDVIQLQCTFTNENNVSTTVTFFPQGLTSANIATTGFFALPPQDIRVKPNTSITIKTVLTTSTGTITYDVGGNIQKLN